MQEELYVSELELSELTKRNSFLNRLQDENNAQALRESRNQVEFQAALDKIDEDRELNEDERLKFSQMLEAQRMIREATLLAWIDKEHPPIMPNVIDQVLHTPVCIPRIDKVLSFRLCRTGLMQRILT